jgi:hypothetical protein
MKIEYVKDDDSEEEDEEDDDEEEIDEDEEDSLEDYKELIKEKTDRELIENIALRLLILEQNMKKVQDDLVDTYNLILEGVDDEDSEED